MSSTDPLNARRKLPLLPQETPRGVFERRVRAAISVAHVSPKVSFEVILVALRYYESDSACGEVRS
jgi:hypothetical protein